MKISKFQFRNPVLLDLQFSVNEGYELDENQKFHIRTDVEAQRIQEGQSSAFVIVTLTVGEKDKSTPFFVSVREQAEFFWNPDDMQDSGVEIERLLNQNAPALLVSYIRPILAFVTNSSPYPVLNLPYLDMRKQDSETSRQESGTA